MSKKKRIRKNFKRYNAECVRELEAMKAEIESNEDVPYSIRKILLDAIEVETSLTATSRQKREALERLSTLHHLVNSELGLMDRFQS